MKQRYTLYVFLYSYAMVQYTSRGATHPTVALLIFINLALPWQIRNLDC